MQAIQSGRGLLSRVQFGLQRFSTALRTRLSSNAISIIAASLLLPVVVVQCYASFVQTGLFLTHDEAEHLHVVFALERGERPYLDFIENHPVLFHLALLWLKNLLRLTEAYSVYALGKLLVLIHFLGCLVLLTLFLRHFSRFLAVQGNCAALILIALAVSGIWTESSEWSWGNSSLWHLRPDWICYFYALLCIAIHFLYHWRLIPNGERLPLSMMAVAGVSGGLATAILAKSIYIFLPYALLIGSIAFTELRAALAWWRAFRRRLIIANVLFLLVGLLSFSVAVWVELRASHVNITEYYKANFLLNSVKHISLNSEDFSPLNVLRSLLGFGLIPTIGLGMWVMNRLAMAQRHGASIEYHVLYFLFLIIGVNMALPSFTNGLTWPQYFVPSLLALLCLLALASDAVFTLIVRIAKISPNQSDKGAASLVWKHMAWGFPLLVTIVFGSALIGRWQGAVHSLDRLSYQGHFYEALAGDAKRDFLPERLMPDDLTYLVFSPQAKPVKARAWGYFFMLGSDRRLWQDVRALGLAPEAEGYWKALYVSQPPDAIVLTNKENFTNRRLILRGMQQVDIEWLWAQMKEDYTCQSRRPLEM